MSCLLLHAPWEGVKTKWAVVYFMLRGKGLKPNELSLTACSDPQDVQVDHAQGVQWPGCRLGVAAPQHRPQSLSPMQPGYVPRQRLSLRVLPRPLLFWRLFSVQGVPRVNVARVWSALPVVDRHATERVVPLHRPGRWGRCLYGDKGICLLLLSTLITLFFSSFLVFFLLSQDFWFLFLCCSSNVFKMCRFHLWGLIHVVCSPFEVKSFTTTLN